MNLNTMNEPENDIYLVSGGSGRYWKLFLFTVFGKVPRFDVETRQFSGLNTQQITRVSYCLQ